MPANHVEFGWGAPPLTVQFPALDETTALHFDQDNMAIIRLSVRGLLTDSQKWSALKKLTKRIEAELRASLNTGART